MAAKNLALSFFKNKWGANSPSAKKIQGTIWVYQLVRNYLTFTVTVSTYHAMGYDFLFIRPSEINFCFKNIRLKLYTKHYVIIC